MDDWTHVVDGLPEAEKEEEAVAVLFVVNGEVLAGRFMKKGKRDSSDLFAIGAGHYVKGFKNSVTHWMYMPKGPVSADEDDEEE